MEDPSLNGDSDPLGTNIIYEAGYEAGLAARNARVRFAGLEDSYNEDNSAIRRIEDSRVADFATLDDLLADVTEAMSAPIADCIKLIFKFAPQQIDLMTNLGFCTLESFIVYGALSVRDMVLTVKRRFLYEPDLALALFLARVLALVFHTHAQTQQHNVLAVGRTDSRVDLKSLPTDREGIEAFVSTIQGYVFKGP